MAEPRATQKPQPNGTWRGVDQFDRTHRAAELATLFDLVTQTPPRTAMKRGIEGHPIVKLERNELVRGRIPTSAS